MALPISRNTTYAGGSPIKPIDLDDLQDAIVGMKHGLIKRAAPPQIVNDAVEAGGWARHVGNYISSVSSYQVRLHLPCAVGDMITGIEVLVFGDGVTDATHSLDIIGSTMDITSKASVNDVNRSAVWSALSVTPTTPFSIANYERLVLSISSSAAGYRVGSLWVSLYRP